MKNVIFLFFTILFFASFTDYSNNSKVILYADNSIGESTSEFRLYADSIFIYNYNYSDWGHKKSEIFRGRYFIKSDTIYFFPFNFKYINSDKAIINNGFIEFLDGDHPLKIKIRNTTLKTGALFDTARFKKYALFSFNPKHYRCFSGNIEPVRLDNKDFNKIDSLVSVFFANNTDSFTLKPKDYYKQCIPVIDSNGNKLVWINLDCGNSRYYEYSIETVYDGGPCYALLTVNLTKGTYYDFWINGYE